MPLISKAAISTRLTIIIVNFRTPDLVIKCLKSLASEIARLLGANVVIVDNGSQDGSAEKIRHVIKTEGWNKWVKLSDLSQNRGFAAGNNAAILEDYESSEPAKFYLLLNPDTVVCRDALTTLLNFMIQRPRIGIAGGRIESPSGGVQCSAHNFPSPLGELMNAPMFSILKKYLPHHVISPQVATAPHPCDWISGAYMLIRYEVIKSVGILDEGFFMYFEETDYCFQSKKAGWEIWYVPDSRVIHLGGSVFNVSDKNAAEQRPKHWFASRRRYYLKNHGFFCAIGADMAWILGYVLWSLQRSIQGKRSGEPSMPLRSFIANSIFIKGIHSK